MRAIRRMTGLAFVSFSAISACAGAPAEERAGSPEVTDPARDAAGLIDDAGLTDAELIDAGLTDAELTDAELTDAGLTDPDASEPAPDAGEDATNDTSDAIDAPTCEEACALVVDCIVDACDGFGEGARPQLSAVCDDQCTPQLAAQFASQSCEENIAALSSRNATVDAACREPGPEPDEGLNALYIGHSFGRPFADELTGVANAVGIDHSQEIVFSGGASGAPQALWDDVNDRTAIQDLLDGGDIDVLIMICCSESFVADGTEPAIRLWMDYALAQNADTSFVLAMPWIDFPEDYADSTVYGDLWHLGHSAWHDVISSLRESYPGVEINCLPHGHGAVELRHLFEDGELGEVDELRRSSRDNEAIFTDPKGHADTVLLDLGGLIWLRSLYDVELTGHPVADNYDTDLIGIAEAILAADEYVR